ncbi:MAG: hypothetical protein GX928_02090 [Ruminococcaceae bacterium]|nr:hypothetical protein [Oscillospiraceae bacterium]
MFGYIIPSKPDLTIRDFNTYRAVYCGLCKTLSNKFTASSRILVGYDFVFLALLSMSLKDEETTVFRERCNTNPLKKVPAAKDNGSIEFSAAMAVLTAHYKLADDMSDEKFIKKVASFSTKLAISRGYKRAKKLYPEIDNLIDMEIESQREIERDSGSSTDLASQSSANGLSAIFEMLSEEENTKRILRRLGYLLGRFIYLCDAGDDLIDDIKYDRFNPLRNRLSQNPAEDEIKQVVEDFKGSLRLNVGEIASTYNLLEIANYREILDNIIFLGLHTSIENIGKPKTGIVTRDEI